MIVFQMKDNFSSSSFPIILIVWTREQWLKYYKFYIQYVGALIFLLNSSSRFFVFNSIILSIFTSSFTLFSLKVCKIMVTILLLDRIRFKNPRIDLLTELKRMRNRLVSFLLWSHQCGISAISAEWSGNSLTLLRFEAEFQDNSI